jgi:type VI secretion system protein ImpA
MSSVAETKAATSAPPVIDLEALLAPLAGANPAGESQQYTSLYDEIREARRADDLLDQGEWKRESKVADWVTTATLAADALKTRTKDLRLCGWLTEALIKLYGFPGLREGLRLTRGMHESFWDGLYPEEDEGDLEARANAISWMERQAALALREVPLTKEVKGVVCDYNDWEESKAFGVGPEVNPETAEARRQRAAEEGKVTSEDWLKAKQTTPRPFYETAHATLDECWEEFVALDRVIDERFGRQTPGMGELKKTLEAVRNLVEIIVKEKRLIEPDPVGSAQAATAAVTTAPGAVGNGFAVAAQDVGGAEVAGPIRTRQEAVRRLTEVAVFFRRTEPQSPVAYLVERAIKWTDMPLEVWLASVVKDSTVLDFIRETLGVDASAQEQGTQE